MTYREPDPEQQAEAERHLAAEERLEADAAAGRDARARGAAGVERRILRRPSGIGIGVAWLGTMVAIGGAAALAHSAVLAYVASAGSLAIVGVGAFGVNRALNRLELRRLRALPYPVDGYREVLDQRWEIISVACTIVLRGLVDADDRARVLDLLGHTDTLDPVVTTTDRSISIEAIISDSRRAQRVAFLRGVIEHVANRLHDLRGVDSVRFTHTFAEPDRRGRY